MDIALPTITTAIRGRRIVRVLPDWTETIALATVTALPSGERKSAIHRAVVAPLRAHEVAAQEAARPTIAEQKAKLKLAEDRADNLRKEAVKSGTAEDEQRYLDAVKKAAEIRVDPLPRWVAADATPEAIVRLLAAHSAVGSLSAEPGLFSILAGRYSGGKPNIETVLLATSGDPIIVDRVSQDEPTHIDRPALSASMCIQPARLPELAVKEFVDSGLLARLLFCIPHSIVGTRSTEVTAVPTDVRDRWHTAIEDLAACTVSAELGVSQSAVKLLNEFRDEIEPKLHPHHGDLAGIGAWGGKLPGAVVRIAAALTLLADPQALEIDDKVMGDAIRLGRAYTEHALAAFGSIHQRDDRLGHARAVLSWVRTKNEGSAFTVRDVHRGLQGRAWVQTVEDIQLPISVLVERGHIRPVARDEAEKSTGRPSSEGYVLHPRYSEKHGQKRQKPAQDEEPEPCVDFVHAFAGSENGKTAQTTQHDEPPQAEPCGECERTDRPLLHGFCRSCRVQIGMGGAA